MKHCRTCDAELVRKRYPQRMESLVEFARRQHCGYDCIPPRRPRAQRNNRSTGLPGITRYVDRGVVRVGVFYGSAGEKRVKHFTVGRRPTKASEARVLAEAKLFREARG